MADNINSNTATSCFKLTGCCFIQRLIRYFEHKNANAQPLTVAAANKLKLAFALLNLLWLLAQGGCVYNADWLPFGIWSLILVFLSAMTFAAASLLNVNLPKASIGLQFFAVSLIAASLTQSLRLSALSSGYIWLVPSILLIPLLYMSLKRNWEPLALLGYLAALLTPVLGGVILERPFMAFSYYLLLCLPVPMFSLLRRWRYLDMTVFISALAAGCYYLALAYNPASFGYAQLLFILFGCCYILAVWARTLRTSFNVSRFTDFVFCFALTVSGVVIQLRIALSHPGGVLFALFCLAIFFALTSVLSRIILGRGGQVLSRAYVLATIVLLNILVGVLCPGTLAVALYSFEAMFFFWLGSATALMPIKAGGFLLLILVPLYFFAADPQNFPGALFIAFSAIACAHIQDRELKRLARRTGRLPWSSGLEFFLVVFGFSWCFGAIAVLSFRDMPAPGLVCFALSSACAYFFFALGRVWRLRSLRVAIFIPMFIAIPAAILPIVYQISLEWPVFSHFVTYNFLDGFGALAWVIYFITAWVALYHNWEGLISSRLHSKLFALVTLELVLVLTSSIRALGLEYGSSPSLLSTFAVLPSLTCAFVLSRIMKRVEIHEPYRTPIFLVLPWTIFAGLCLWFLSALSSPGDASPGGKYIPLLNPVEVMQVASVMIFAYWQRRLGKSSPPMPHLSDRAMRWVYAMSSFMWLHGVMFRVVQYFSQAPAREVIEVAELRIIFAGIWVVYGIIFWVASTSFASVLAWGAGVILLAAGCFSLVHLAIWLWGTFVAVVIGICSLSLLAMLLWRSPAPFTERGKKAAREIY